MPNNTTTRNSYWYKTHLDEAKDQGDYMKAAELIDEYKGTIEDREIRNQLSIQAGQLRSAYHKEQALLDNVADPLARKAYYFKKAIETNTVPLDVRQNSDNANYHNEYWDEYNAAITAFGSDGDKTAATVNFKFDNKNYYKDFLDATKLTTQELSPTYYADGTVSIDVAKSNSNLFFKVLDGVNTLDDIAYVQRNGFFEDMGTGLLNTYARPATRALRNLKNSDTLGDYFSTVLKGLGDAVSLGFGSRTFRDTFVDITGYDEGNNPITSFSNEPGVFGWTRPDKGVGTEALTIYYDALRKVQEIERYSQENTYDIIALDFTTPAQAEALKRLNNGLMSEDDYKKWTNTEQDIINTALLGTPFSKADVFTDDGESDNLYMVSDEDKKALNRIFIDALRDGRVDTKAAIMGGDIGIMCNILEKSSDKGSITDDEDSSFRGRKIFIKNMPNNLQNLLNESFNANSQYKAIKEYSQLTAWGYEYETRNGDRISNVDNTGGWYREKDADQPVFKTRDEIHKLLNEDFAMNDIILGLNIDIAKTSNSNKLGFSYQNNTDAMAARAAIALAKENGYIEGTTDYITTVKRLYDEILKGIDYTGPQGLTLHTNTINR